MTYQAEREAFLLQMQAEGMTPEIARRILRHANTIQRLSAAECNGDYPCDNGERKVEACSRCEAGYVRSSMVKDRGSLKPSDVARGDIGDIPLICPNCHAQDLIARWCEKASPRFILNNRRAAILKGNYATAQEAWDAAAQGSHAFDVESRHFSALFQGDPRGACVKLLVPSGKTDDHAREGICVPTRRY